MQVIPHVHKQGQRVERGCQMLEVFMHSARHTVEVHAKALFREAVERQSQPAEVIQAMLDVQDWQDESVRSTCNSACFLACVNRYEKNIG